MADIERPLRAMAMQLLAPWFRVSEEARVTLRDGHCGRVDVLAVPHDTRFSGHAFAIEVKARSRMVENGLALWFKQASDYVAATPAEDAPLITSAFLWMVGMDAPEAEADRVRLRSMVDLAHQYRTGIVKSDGMAGYIMQMGPDEVFRSRGWRGTPADPWPGRALERLGSSRQAGGSRRGVTFSTNPG